MPEKLESEKIQMKSAKYKITEDGKLIKKGKIKLFLPKYNGFREFLDNLLKTLPIEEQLYVCKMLQFHYKFPPDDIITSEYIDYTKMLEQDVIAKSTNGNNGNASIQEQLYSSMFNNRCIQLYMSKESYLNFKLSVLDEMDVVEADIEKMMHDCMDREIQKLSFRKRVKLVLKRKKIKNMEQELWDETYKILNRGCKTVDSKLVRHQFYEEAGRLLEQFHEKKYQELIKNLMAYLEEEYAVKKTDYTKEEMEYIASGKSREEKRDILIWIYENTSPRGDAFDAMKLDAEMIYLRCLHLFHVDYYKKNYKKMNPEERRMYQLLFLSRDSFLGRIPAFDPFFSSFWKNNLELIMEGLIIKNGNPDYREKNEELKEKWIEFINLYPMARKVKPVFDRLSDKEACVKTVNRMLKGVEAKVIKAFLDGHDIQTICAAYDVESEECGRMIQRFREVMAKDEEAE